TGTILLLTLHTVMPFQYDQSRMNNSLGNLYIPDSVADAHESVARSLDTLLTACHADRYLIAQANPELKYIYALTKYSPYQIAYGQQRALGGFAQGATDKPNEYLADQLRRDLATTRIIIATETGAIPSSIAQVIQTEFTEQAY